MKDTYLIAAKLYQESISAGAPENICHCCHAPISYGVQGCFELFGQLCARGYSDPLYGGSLFYGVDAHALQHPEIHGKKNNAVHLLRLSWIFDYERHDQSGTVPKWWQSYLERSNIPHLEPPQERGEITVVDVIKAQTPQEHAELMKQWAQSVCEAWHSHHAWAQAELQSIFRG